jgi:hypothetical protein
MSSITNWIKKNWSGLILSLILFSYFITLAMNWDRAARFLSALLVHLPSVLGWILYILLLFALPGIAEAYTITPA